MYKVFADHESEKMCFKMGKGVLRCVRISTALIVVVCFFRDVTKFKQSGNVEWRLVV